MIKGWHFHTGAVTIPNEKSDQWLKSARDEIMPIITEGYWIIDLQNPTPLVQKVGKSWSQIGAAQAIGAIPARISTLDLFTSLRLEEIIRKVGYNSIKDLQMGLAELYRPKPNIDWFTVIFFGRTGILGEPKTPDSHFHPEDSITLDGNHFRFMSEGKITLAAEEGYRIFNFNKPVKINDPSGELIGFGEVIPFSTRISALHRLNNFLPISHILKASTSRTTKEYLLRMFNAQYPNKRDKDWVTFSTVYVLEKIRLPKAQPDKTA